MPERYSVGQRLRAIYPTERLSYPLLSTDLSTLFKRVFLLVGPISLLLAGLYINKRIGTRLPALWLIIPILLAAVMASARYIEAEKPVVRLWQLLGSLSAVYALVHYPLMPLASDDSASGALYALVLCVWVASLAAGVICFRIPSLSVLPPSFLLWSNSVAGTITGLPTAPRLGVLPLSEISICIAIGLLINRIYSRSPESSIWNAIERLINRIHSRPQNIFANGVVDERIEQLDVFLRRAFARLLCLVAIGIHLANYFWSFYAKATLPGPLLAWLWENNPAYIFLAALDDGHILFLANQQLVEYVFTVLDRVYIVSNFGILVVQAAAITAFFLPTRAVIILLLLFDLMHASIILIVGANFWPWILLNVIITYVVAGCDFQQGIVGPADKGFDGGARDLVLRLLATGFILIAPCFVNVARLGWYDSGANNRLFFEAVDESGTRHYVPTNYFTFYSAWLVHMDYGTPEPETAFATEKPNGGAYDYELFKAGRTCDLNALRRPHRYDWSYRDRLSEFVRNYHRVALKISSTLGAFPYNAYPHHFYVPGILTEDFDRLDKRRIVAYIYRRESVCLGFSSGRLQRVVRGVAEHRIDVGQENSHDGVGR